MEKRITLFCVMLLCLLLIACDPTTQIQVVEERSFVTIKNLVENPEEYLDKKIWIRGEIKGNVERQSTSGHDMGTLLWLVSGEPEYLLLDEEPSCTTEFLFKDGDYSIRVLEERSSLTCKIPDPAPQGRFSILGMLYSKEGDLFLEFLGIDE